MSSTEYTSGHFGKKSSRVLKPPGGGSSDIFGLGNPSSTTAQPAAEPVQADDSSTQSRLFGFAPKPIPVSTPQKTSSSVFMTQTPSSVSKKQYVRRNPITGEGFDCTDEKSESSEKENEEKSETQGSEKVAVNPEVPAPQVIQSSIRIRNPPGGKSSGIF